MFKKVNKNEIRKAKHSRIRFTLKGTSDMPRLNVYRSTNEIYAQIIDDNAGKTLCSASSKDKALAKAVEGKNIKLVIPEKRYCTDNGAMIGAEGYLQYLKGNYANLDLNASAVMPLK